VFCCPWPALVLCGEVVKMTELMKRSVGIRASTDRRFLAYMIDVAVMYLLAMAAPALAMVVTFLLRIDPAVQMGLAVGSMAVTPILYLWLCVGRWGQTMGKRILGIRVVTVDGMSVDYGRALVRAVAELVLALPWGLTWWPLLGKSKRALHDYLAGTQVIRDRPLVE